MTLLPKERLCVYKECLMTRISVFPSDLLRDEEFLDLILSVHNQKLYVHDTEYMDLVRTNETICLIFLVLVLILGNSSWYSSDLLLLLYSEYSSSVTTTGTLYWCMFGDIRK
jgi:hypothetical protein